LSSAPPSALASATAAEETVRTRLEDLRAAGARTFDPPAFDFVVTLLATAASLTAAAQARLLERARARTAELETAFQAARARADASLSQRADLRDSSTTAFEAGAFVEILRRARREHARPKRAAPQYTGWLARLRAESVRRGIRAREGAAAGATPSEAEEVRRLTTALYESSRAQVEAAMTAHSAAVDLPEDAGPYNPLALAVGVLAELAALSPAYLAALVGSLSELGALLALPPVLPPARPSTSPARPRRIRKARP